MPRENIHRAAAYIRQSDEKQSNFSPAFQRGKILAYCKEEGIPIMEEHIFFDGRSAKYWRDRKGLKALLAAAARKEFDVLVMYRLDRFSRDHEHQIILREQLKYYGVTIITLDPEEHASGDSIADRIIQLVFSLFAELELRKITERTHDGLQERYLAGFLPVSRRPLYGYSWEDRTIIVHGEVRTVPKAVYVLKETIIRIDKSGKKWTEYKVVQYMFELADEGIALRRIAKTLTELGIPTPDRKQANWTPQTVLDKLRHRGYTGKHIANKLKFTYEPGVGWHKEIRPEEEWIALPEGVIVPLVSIEQFERVQRRLDTNRQNAPRNNPDHETTLLRAGYVLCGYCGAKLTVHRDLKKKVIAYQCSVHKQGYAKCKLGCYVVAYLADNAAWLKAVEVIRKPSLIEEKLAERQKQDKLQDEIDSLTRLIEEIVPRMKNIMETIEESPKGEGRGVLVAHLGELQAQKTHFEEDRDLLMRQMQHKHDTQQKIAEFKEWCDEIRPQLADGALPEFPYKRKRDAIEYLGIHVRVFKVDHKPHMQVEFDPPVIVSTSRSTS